MRNNEQKIYLSPVDGRKSFYGKCYVIGDEKYGYMLYSYDTLVARFIPGRGLVRSWEGWSATTQRHINAFARFCGVNKSGKKWWDTVFYL